MLKHLTRCLVLAAIAATGFANAQDGEALYTTRCAACHENPDPQANAHAPARADMARFTPNSVYAAMRGGLMRPQATGLSDAQMRSVAAFLTGRQVTDLQLEITSNLCTDNPPLRNPALGPSWNGWGPDNRNARFADSGLTAEDIPRLRLAWAYGLPGEGQARAQPAVVAGRVFVGNGAGALYSLDAKSGCTYWSYLPRSGLRSAVSVGPHAYEDGDGYAAYFVDSQGNAYAVNAHSGETIWVRKVDDHPNIRGTGAVTLHDGVLYVPMSGVGEESAAGNPEFACCTFRGSVSAFDTQSGDLLWKYHTLPEPQPMGVNANGVERFGPAGIGIWSAPTVDDDRGLLYVATGNAYSGPAPETADAVVAIDMKTGEQAWVTQLLPADAWNGGCTGQQPGANCPEENGPDFDFSASPLLTTTPAGRELLVVPQKSGFAFALDPNNRGELVWQYRAGPGSPVGGVWGAAAGDGLAYVAVGGYIFTEGGGIHGIDLETGEQVWYTPPQDLLCQAGPGCSATQSAAVTAVPGAVFSGSADGGMRAYAADTGEVLWTFDANRAFDTVNGVEANGASFDGPGPVIVDGMLYLLSGNAGFVGRPGNVLLAFAVGDE